MDKRPIDILRRKEAKDEGFDLSSDDIEIIRAMIAKPRALERPIVINGDKVAIGCPPKAVLAIL